jgi:hypothetical protein
VLSEDSPGQGIRYGIPSIFLDPPLHELSIALSKEALLLSFIGEVNDDEPCRNGDDLYRQALNNLSLIRFTPYAHVCPLRRTNIHCQPLRPPTPSILIRPYARTFEIPPTLTENK